MKIKVVKTRSLTLKICLSAICLALAMVLPFLTGAIPEIGGMLCPMHIPSLLLGIVAGPFAGSIIAFLSPLIRGLVFGSPILFPRGVAMAFELFAYALVFGMLYAVLPKKAPYTYAALVAAMLAGRVVGGTAKLILFSFGAIGSFGLNIFFTSYFIETIPGAVLQILLIPPLVYSLKKAKIIY